MSWENEDEFVQEMLESGAMKDYFMDPDGEWICQWDIEILKKKYPDVAKAVQEEMMKELQDSLSDLVDQGFLQMSFQENEDGSIEPVYSATEKGNEIAEEIERQFRFDS